MARMLSVDAFARAIADPITHAPDRAMAALVEQLVGAETRLTERFDRHEVASAVPSDVRLLEVIAAEINRA